MRKFCAYLVNGFFKTFFLVLLFVCKVSILAQVFRWSEVGSICHLPVFALMKITGLCPTLTSILTFWLRSTVAECWYRSVQIEEDYIYICLRFIFQVLLRYKFLEIYLLLATAMDIYRKLTFKRNKHEKYLLRFLDVLPAACQNLDPTR